MKWEAEPSPTNMQAEVIQLSHMEILQLSTPYTTYKQFTVH